MRIKPAAPKLPARMMPGAAKTIKRQMGTCMPILASALLTTGLGRARLSLFGDPRLGDDGFGGFRLGLFLSFGRDGGPALNGSGRHVFGNLGHMLSRLGLTLVPEPARLNPGT